MFMPGVWILCSKKNFFFVIIFQKENGNTFTLLIIFIVKSLQKEPNSTNLLLWPPISLKRGQTKIIKISKFTPFLLFISTMFNSLLNYLFFLSFQLKWRHVVLWYNRVFLEVRIHSRRNRSYLFNRGFKSLRIHTQGCQGCQKIRNFVRNSKILIARSTIQPKLSKIKNH